MPHLRRARRTGRGGSLATHETSRAIEVFAPRVPHKRRPHLFSFFGRPLPRSTCLAGALPASLSVSSQPSWVRLDYVQEQSHAAAHRLRHQKCAPCPCCEESSLMTSSKGSSVAGPRDRGSVESLSEVAPEGLGLARGSDLFAPEFGIEIYFRYRATIWRGAQGGRAHVRGRTCCHRARRRHCGTPHAPPYGARAREARVVREWRGAASTPHFRERIWPEGGRAEEAQAPPINRSWRASNRGESCWSSSRRRKEGMVERRTSRGKAASFVSLLDHLLHRFLSPPQRDPDALEPQESAPSSQHAMNPCQGWPLRSCACFAFSLVSSSSQAEANANDSPRTCLCRRWKPVPDTW